MRRRKPAPVAAAHLEAKRCAIYTRKSTTAGLDQAFTSLDAQRESGISYIQRQPGWTVLEERYDDGGFTGANIDRPAFQRLLHDVEARKIDCVVVYKVDRLSRSLMDFAAVMARFNTANVAFVSVTQNFSTADSMGRLTLNMLMSFAQFEREMISERTRDKVAASRRKGKWTGGTVPLGYNVETGRLVVNELEAVVVQEIFALYLERRSTLEVARILNSSDRRTKRHRSIHGNPREPHDWTTNDVARVLKHPIYAGYMSSGGTLFEGEHSAIVERVVFARVQAALREGTPNRSVGVRNPAYLLRGVLRCAGCGAAFTTASTISHGVTYRYYRCGTRDKQGAQACGSQPLPAEAIEQLVIQRVRAATADGTLAGDVAASVRRRIQARREACQIEREHLPARIASLSQEIRRLVDVLATVEGGARQQVQSRLQELEDQSAHSEADLVASTRQLAELDAVEVDVTWVAQSLADFDRVWDRLTVENRGRLVRAVIHRVEVDEPGNTVRVVLADLGANLADPSTPTPPERVPLAPQSPSA